MDLRGKRVFVGLSGGVDSAVTAAILKESGAAVRGVFIKGWYPPGLPCTWSEDRRDAMRVAARLAIPFTTLDASEAYKRSVIDYLVREYREGRTPNPDIMCNRDVKFGAFYDFARKEGADFIATGHYTRVEPHISRLYRGIDDSKDQSYFLWAVPKDILPHVLFPLGAMHKSEVRRLAARYSLPVADKKDSQGICFLGPVSIEEFLKSEVGLTPGRAVDGEGREVGQHEGAIAYTLGERASLTDALPGPWYVTRKDIQSNTITVAHALQTAPSAARAAIPIHSANWHIASLPQGEVSAQYRYHGPVVAGKVSTDGSSFTPSHGLREQIAPGQSLVFYDGDTLLGGGIIGA